MDTSQGDRLTYSVTMRNLGPATAPNPRVRVTFTGSPDSSYPRLELSPGCEQELMSRAVVCSFADIPPGEVVFAQFAVTVYSPGIFEGSYSLVATATAQADTRDPNTTNNSAQRTVQVHL